MTKHVEEWFRKCSDEYLSMVGDMSTQEVEQCEDLIINWVLSDDVSPLLRSGLLTRVSAYDLSKALAIVLEKQNKDEYARHNPTLEPPGPDLEATNENISIFNKTKW